MENKNLHGVPFTATIKGAHVSGHISYYNETYYLCQDVFCGASCPEKFGHQFSWYIGLMSEHDLIRNEISNLRFTNDETPVAKTKFNVEEIVRIKGKSRDYKVFIVKDKEYWLKALKKKKIIGPIHEDQLELSSTKDESLEEVAFLSSQIVF